jgi:tetratricopeptide (TPR) repeat protein
MGKDAELNQLIDAVKRHPGSPAFALLAEHYLEQGQLEEARQVAQEGFAANPGYERGVVAYLSILRQEGNSKKGGEVFGRAVAYLPRSSKLRLEWAMILAEAGRDQEARRFAREAMNLDPLSRDARALVATLGEGANPLSITREEAGSSTEDADDGLQQEANQLFDDSGPISVSDLSSQARSQRAAIRPRVRPIGQRTTPHALFDLTPGPMMEDSRHVSPRDLQASPFDLTPMPMVEQETAPEEDPTVESEVPVMDDGPPAPSPPPAPGVAAAPPPPPPPPGVVITPRRPRMPTGEDLRDLPQSSPHRWLWIPTIAVVLIGAGVAGFFVYRHLQEKKLIEAVRTALHQTTPDQLDGYIKARGQLIKLRRKQPNDPRVLAAVALVDAHLATRFAGDPSLIRESQEAAAKAKQHPLAHAAAMLLAAHQGKPIPNTPRRAPTADWPAWHLTLAEVLAAEPDKRGPLLDAAVSPPKPAPALLLEAAKLNWQRRQWDTCAKLVQRGLGASKGHPGLLILEQRLALRDGKPASNSALEQLANAAGSIPRYRASLEVLTAELLTARGELLSARNHAKQAVAQAPEDVEAGMTLGQLLLEPDGDAAEALALLERHTPSIVLHDPLAAGWQAKALLLLARPHEACRLFKDGQVDDDRLAGLEVRCAHLSDDEKRLERRCAKPAGPHARIACIEAWLRRGKPRQARQLVRKLTAAQLLYVRGLRSLVRGDTKAAIKALDRVKTAQLPDPVAARLALAEAYSRQGGSNEAVEIMRRVVKDDARSVRSRMALARALVESGHDTEAQTLLEEVLRAKPTQASVLAKAGEIFLSLGLAAKAQRLLRHGLKFTTSTPLSILAGRVALANKELDEARAVFTGVLKREPSNTAALVELGRIEAAAKNRAAARKLFAKALRLRPKDPELLLSLSRVRAQSGDYRNALGYGTKAVRLFKETGQKFRTNEALIELGRIFSGGDRWAQARAEELLFEATKVKNPPPNALLELGKLYRARRETNKAIWCFRKAVERDPNYAEGYLELGQALSTKRKWRRDARRAFKRYLKLRPKSKEAGRVKNLLKRLR